VTWYRRAVGSGHRDFWWDRSDPLFAPLASEPEFLEWSDPSRLSDERAVVAAVAGRLSATMAIVERRFQVPLSKPASASGRIAR
jgi:hypothetical protein